MNKRSLRTYLKKALAWQNPSHHQSKVVEADHLKQKVKDEKRESKV
jgi:hypothetical protein